MLFTQWAKAFVLNQCATSALPVYRASNIVCFNADGDAATVCNVHSLQLLQNETRITASSLQPVNPLQSCANALIKSPYLFVIDVEKHSRCVSQQKTLYYFVLGCVAQRDKGLLALVRLYVQCQHSC